MASPAPPPPSVRFLQLKDVFHRAVTLGIDCLDKEVSRVAATRVAGESLSLSPSTTRLAPLRRARRL